MKKVLASSVVVLMVLFLSAGFGLAGNGQGTGNGSGNGGGNGTGNCVGTGISLVCDGTAVTVSGTVSEESYLANGLQIDTGSKIVTVYGIGPYWYWENVERPVIGDEVSVEGREVTFSDGSTKIIVMSISMGESTIQLRDSDTCLPLWRGGNGNSN